MFTCPFVYTNTQTHTNSNTKFLCGPRKKFYHKLFQVSFSCQDFPYGNSVRAEHSCTGNIRKGTSDWKAQNLQRVAGMFVYPLFWVCFRT